MSKELDAKIEALEKEVAQLKRIKELEGELAELKKETKQEGCQYHHHFYPWYQAWYPVYPQPVPTWEPYKVTWTNQGGTTTIRTDTLKSKGHTLKLDENPMDNAIYASNSTSGVSVIGTNVGLSNAKGLFVNTDAASRGLGVSVNKTFDGIY